MKQIHYIPLNKNYTPWRPNGVALELLFSRISTSLELHVFGPLIFDKSWLANVRTDVSVPDGFSRLTQV